MSATDHDLELLRRHAPRLFLDALERYAPVAVDPYLAVSIAADGAQPAGGPPADLSAGADGAACTAGLHLDPTPGLVPAPGQRLTGARADAVFAHFAPAPPPQQWRVYGEVLRSAGRRVLQYWCFYPDNPFGLGLCDLGRHVSDWEQVLVEIDADDRTVAVIVYQHGSPQRVKAGDPRLTLDADGHPHVYVAEGSHAIYLTAGSQPRILKRDNTSADGLNAVPQVLPLPSDAGIWASWCGRWGPDTGLDLPQAVLLFAHWIVRKSIGGDSPPGPHGKGRGKPKLAPAPTTGGAQPINRLSSLLVRLGGHLWPKDVEIEGAATLAGGAVGLRVRTGGGLLRRARYVDATAFDAQGAAVGHARGAVGSDGDVDLAVQLLAGTGAPVEVRVAGYNRFDQRGTVLRAPVAAAG